VPGEPVCREHKKVPVSAHGDGERSQVRWRDVEGKQRARTFARKTGTDPEKSADAFDAKVRTHLDDGSYVSPADASTTLWDFAEDWRKTRTPVTCTGFQPAEIMIGADGADLWIAGWSGATRERAIRRDGGAQAGYGHHRDRSFPDIGKNSHDHGRGAR
jgi:hypothetical protein